MEQVLGFRLRHRPCARLSALAGPVYLGGEPLAAVREINHDVVDVMIVLRRVAYDANISQFAAVRIVVATRPLEF
jgi:hypothetical protein